MKNLIKSIFILFCIFFLSVKENLNAQTVVTLSYSASSQTWTVPSCVTTATVYMWSGGGGGGGGGYMGGDGDNFMNGGGGGGGACLVTTISTLVPAQVYTVTTGKGGTAGNTSGTNGGTGGTTTFTGGAGTWTVAGGTGGTGQANENDAVTAAGGPGSTTGTGANIVIFSGGNGSTGYNGTTDANGYTGSGGGSGGSGGNGVTPTSGICTGGGTGGIGTYPGGTGGKNADCGTTTDAAGTAGAVPGGGGGSDNNWLGGEAGGAGGNGKVIIVYNTIAVAGNVIENDSCHGTSNGRASAIAISGATPFTYSWSPSGGTHDTAVGLSAGIYTVTVHDPCGNSATASVTITQPNIVSVTAVATQTVSCNGGNNGIATADVSGGGTPYTYLWTDLSSQTTVAATGLVAGTYTVTVNDACGGTSTASVTITQPIALSSVSTNVISNISCTSGSNGEISATVSGGGIPYTYTWSPSSQSTATASGLTAGTYVITVQDICGASTSASVTITEPATSLVVSASVNTNISCNGNYDGSTVSTVTGGGTPYTYTWTPYGGNAATASGLSAGTYTLTVTDNYGCTLSSSATITQPGVLSALAGTTANVNCFGDSTGSATSGVAGGVAPYTYVWSPYGGNAASATGLAVGTYTLNITDNNGCSTQAITTVTQPAAALVVTANATANELCNNGNIGSATSNTSGGTSPYAYTWAPSGGSTDSAVGLTAGTYTLNISDNHGCTASATVTITQPNAMVVTTDITSNATCHSGYNGSISSNVTGGTSPYNYSWTGGAGNTDTAVGLSAGTYTLTVTDRTGCTATAASTITEPNILSASANPTANVLCNGDSNGSASTNVSGGTSPYTYSWYPSGQTTATATGLSAGSYNVSVNDACGDLSVATVTITQPNALGLAANTTANVLCHGGTDGTASSSVTAGKAPYTYAWSGGGSNSSVGGLSAGTYTLTVQDNNGCSITTTTTVTQPAVLSIAKNSIPDDGNCTGAAWVNVSGGTSPYNYLWSNTTTSYLDSNLCKGDYCCTVTDANGCHSDSVCVIISSYLGVADIEANTGQITVYPNPNNGRFTILSSVGEKSLVEIYNVLGEKVYTTNLTSAKGSNIVNISNQPSGVYLYKVITETGTLVGEGKLILQK